jgi:hypothetical protein
MLQIELWQHCSHNKKELKRSQLVLDLGKQGEENAIGKWKWKWQVKEDQS